MYLEQLLKGDMFRIGTPINNVILLQLFHLVIP